MLAFLTAALHAQTSPASTQTVTVQAEATTLDSPDVQLAKSGVDVADTEALIRTIKGNNRRLIAPAMSVLGRRPRTQANVDALMSQIDASDPGIVMNAASALLNLGETGWTSRVAPRLVSFKNYPHGIASFAGLLAKAGDYTGWPLIKQALTEPSFTDTFGVLSLAAPNFVGMRNGAAVVDIAQELDELRPKLSGQMEQSAQWIIQDLRRKVKLWDRITPIHPRSRPWEWLAEHTLAFALAEAGINRADIASLRNAASGGNLAALYALGQLPPELVGDFRVPSTTFEEQQRFSFLVYQLTGFRETGWLSLLARSLPYFPDVTNFAGRSFQHDFAFALACAGDYSGWDILRPQITSKDKATSENAIRGMACFFGMQDAEGRPVDVAAVLEAQIQDLPADRQDLANTTVAQIRRLRIKPPYPHTQF